MSKALKYQFGDQYGENILLPTMNNRSSNSIDISDIENLGKNEDFLISVNYG